jgi:hypothetical protein
VRRDYGPSLLRACPMAIRRTTGDALELCALERDADAAPVEGARVGGAFIAGADRCLVAR